MTNDCADHENFDDSIPPTLRADQLVIAGYGNVSREAVINAAALEAPACDWAHAQRVLRARLCARFDGGSK